MLGALDLSRPRRVAGTAVLVGLLAGLLGAVFISIAGEPSVDAAIAIEEAAAAAAPDAGHEVEIVARDMQKGLGLFAAYVLTGGAFGLLLGVAFIALARSGHSAFRRALLAGAGLAGTITVSPWLKYPPNPPAVGDPGTLAQRQASYVGLIALTGLVVFGAARLSAGLRDRAWPEHRRIAAVVAAVGVPLLLAYAALPPAPDAVAVPATLVWRFRVASLGGNLLLWTVLSVGFGWLVAERERGAAPVPTPCAAVP